MASESETQLPNFYEQLRPNLSQGDIVRGVPPCVLDHPTTFCRPDGGKPGRAFYAPVSEPQRTTPFAGGRTEILHATGQAPGLGMVIWEDCQIDKFKNQGHEERKWYVAVAPVQPIERLPTDDVKAAIREGRRMAFFPIPAVPTLGIPESFVDLRLLWPMRQLAIQDRVISISNESKAAMFAHLFQFFTARRLAADVTCPTCQSQIPAEAFFPAGVVE